MIEFPHTNQSWVGWLVLELTIVDCTQIVVAFSAFVLTTLAFVVMFRLRMWRQTGNMILLMAIIGSDALVSFGLTCSTTWYKLAGTFFKGIVRQCSNLQCGILTSFFVFGTTLEMLLTVVIAIDRIYALRSPMAYMKKKSNHWNWIALLVCSLVSVGTSLAGFDYAHAAITDSMAHGNYGGYVDNFSPNFANFCVLLSYLTLALYVVLMYTARRGMGGPGPGSGTNGNEPGTALTASQLKRQRKITKFVLALVTVYMCTLCTGNTILALAPYVCTEYTCYMSMIANGTLLLYANPFVNFFVYAWKMEELRNALLQHVFGHCGGDRFLSVSVGPAISTNNHVSNVTSRLQNLASSNSTRHQQRSRLSNTTQF